MESTTDIHSIVKETLKGLGFTSDEPHELQADMLYIRNLRKGSEEAHKWAKRAVITTLIPSVLYLGWKSIKQLME